MVLYRQLKEVTPQRRKVMRKMNENTRRFVEVKEVAEIYRTSDNFLYTVYKDDNNKYYMDAYDSAPSVTELNGTFDSDKEAVKYAQEFLDEE